MACQLQDCEIFATDTQTHSNHNIRKPTQASTPIHSMKPKSVFYGERQRNEEVV